MYSTWFSQLEMTVGPFSCPLGFYLGTDLVGNSTCLPIGSTS